MQKSITNFFIALIISVTAVAQQPVYAVSNNNLFLPAMEPSFSVVILPEKVGTAFRVFVQNPEKRKIEIQITHRELGVLVDSSITEQQFNCRYNFDKVEDGHYQVILINGKERITRDIEINTVSKRNLVIR